MLNALLAEDPGDSVGNVTLAAAVRANDGGDSVSSEDYFGVVGEGFKAGDFQALEFEHSLNSSCLGQPQRHFVRVSHYKLESLRMSTTT